MKEYLPVLQSAALFEGIDSQEILPLLACLGAKVQTYTKGSFLLYAGDQVDALGVLLYGNALIVQDDFWGNRNLLANIGTGAIFAETFACTPDAPSSVSVIAEAKCGVLWLKVAQILSTCPTACARHTLMIRNLLADLAGKNLRFNEKLTHMGQRTTKEKLLSYLSAEAKRHGVRAFSIPFSRQQLADYLCVERSAMSAALCKLRDEGILTFHKNHFVLNGVEQLK